MFLGEKSRGEMQSAALQTAEGLYNSSAVPSPALEERWRARCQLVVEKEKVTVSVSGTLGGSE